MTIHDSDDSAVIPKAPEVRNPVTASPSTRAAGTRIGLKITKSGVATVRPMRVPARVRPEMTKRMPPTGKRVITARICEVEGPPGLFSGMNPGRCWCSAMDGGVG